MVFLLYSWYRDKDRTIKALKVALKKGYKLFPTILLILLLIGILFVLFPPQLIREFLGGDLNIIQIIAASLFGSFTMIPSIIALPLAGSLVDAGASYTSIAAFITTLTMVGFITLPLEIKELGKKITLWRNSLAFIFAILISLLIGVVI